MSAGTRTFATVVEVGPWRERSIIVGDPESVLEVGTDADVEMVVDEVFDTDMKMKMLLDNETVVEAVPDTETVVEAVPDTETVLPSLLGSHTEQVAHWTISIRQLYCAGWCGRERGPGGGGPAPHSYLAAGHGWGEKASQC